MAFRLRPYLFREPDARSCRQPFACDGALAQTSLAWVLLAGLALGTPLAQAHSWHDVGPVSPEMAAARAELMAEYLAEQRRAMQAAAAATSVDLPSGPARTAADPAGYGTAMAASFGAFKPRVRAYWDATTFYVECDGLPDPAAEERSHELREALEVALRGSPARERRMLEQVIAGVSYRAIATQEGLSIGALKVRLHRLRVHLRVRVRQAAGMAP